jgi:hypothetical protein
VIEAVEVLTLPRSLEMACSRRSPLATSRFSRLLQSGANLTCHVIIAISSSTSDRWQIAPRGVALLLLPAEVRELVAHRRAEQISQHNDKNLLCYPWSVVWVGMRVAPRPDGYQCRISHRTNSTACRLYDRGPPRCQQS